MNADASDLPWTEDQWNLVRQTVHDEAMRARAAASFLPLYGPLPADTEVVPADRLSLGENDYGGQAEARLKVDDFQTLRLVTVAVNVYLKAQQVADPELSAALTMFRRAAAVTARIEDAILFNGQEAAGCGPLAGANGVPPVYTVSGGDGLAHQPGLMTASPFNEVKVTGGSDKLIAGVVQAIGVLEGHGQFGPFALVLGDQLFEVANTPDKNSLVLPSERIKPFLDGPLLRSSAIDPKSGVLVALQGAPVEVVVPKDISVTYLQASLEPRYVLRVSQRFVLRIKENTALINLKA